MYSLEKDPAVISNRTRVEILASILNVAEQATLKTHIMYKANLSWTALEKQIEHLEKKGLVESADDDGRKVYRLSDRGFRLLKQFLEVREDLSLFPLEK